MGPPPVASQLIDLARTLLVVVAGLWVLFRYRMRREGKPVVRMALAARVGVGPSAQPGLFVRLHATNVSSVVLRRVVAALDLLVPDALGPQRWRFDALATTELTLPLTSEIECGPGRIELIGEATTYLEPGECMQSEAFIPLPDSPPELMALRLSLVSTQAALRRRAFRWVIFAFVPLDQMDERFCPISWHANDLPEVHSAT